MQYVSFKTSFVLYIYMSDNIHLRNHLSSCQEIKIVPPLYIEWTILLQLLFHGEISSTGEVYIDDIIVVEIPDEGTKGIVHWYSLGHTVWCLVINVDKTVWKWYK